MTHFGRLLKSLREGRALSQEKLAAEAGVARFTLRRAEQSERFNLRRSNALAIYNALQRFKPQMSEAESSVFLRLAGLDQGLSREQQVVANAAAAALPDRDAHRRVISQIANTAQSQMMNPDAASSHDIIEKLIQEKGAHNVVTALEGLCAAWAIDPPPRRTHETVGPLGVWAVVHESTVEDRVVRKFYPTAPRQADAAARKPKVS